MKTISLKRDVLEEGVGRKALYQHEYGIWGLLTGCYVEEITVVCK